MTDDITMEPGEVTGLGQKFAYSKKELDGFVDEYGKELLRNDWYTIFTSYHRRNKYINKNLSYTVKSQQSLIFTLPYIDVCIDFLRYTSVIPFGNRKR